MLSAILIKGTLLLVGGVVFGAGEYAGFELLKALTSNKSKNLNDNKAKENETVVKPNLKGQEA